MKKMEVQSNLEKITEIYYQPIFCVNSLKIKKFEVLVRSKKTKENTSCKIIDLVRTQKKEFDLDKIILTKVCKELSKKGVLNKFTANVNLFDETIKIKNSAKELLKILKEFDIDLKKITFEINEFTNFDDENVLENLNTLENGGVNISIDDFGQGNSNIKLLKMDIPFKEIKFDKKYTKNLKEEKKHIVKKLINSFNNDCIDVIVEGVEEEAHLKVLTEIGEHCVQGYYLAKPMNLRSFKRFIVNYEKKLNAPCFCTDCNRVEKFKRACFG